MTNLPIDIDEILKEVLSRQYYRGLDKKGWSEAQEKDDIAQIKQAIAQEINTAKIEGIKLVDKALLDNVTGSHPTPVIRNLINLLIWEYTPTAEKQANLQKEVKG